MLAESMAEINFRCGKALISILKSLTILKKITDSVKSYLKKAIYIVKHGDKYILTVNVEFNTFSGASDFV